MPVLKAMQECAKRERRIYMSDCVRLKTLWLNVLQEANIQKRYINCNLPAIEARGVPESVKVQYKRVEAFIDNLITNLACGKGLILKGPTGTMKTTLAVAVLQEALAMGESGLLINMSSLLDKIFSMKDSKPESRLTFEQKLIECKLLVLDDLGTEYSEGWVQTKVNSIISERYDRMRSSIYTTNFTNEQLKASEGGRYADRIIDRFREDCEVINFTGKSLRRG